MRIAYYSPLPPSRSGIADYSTLLLPALERLVEVEVVRAGRVRPVRGTDVALYHVGNDPDAHGWIVDALRRRPGVVVLHEFVLHHLVAGLTVGRKNGPAYLAAMEREAGVPGRLLGYGVLEGRVPPLWEVRPDEFPLAGEVLDLAAGLVVHSRFVEGHARAAGYEGPIELIPHPAWPPPAVEPARLEGDPVIGCFGHLVAAKRIAQLLAAFALLRERHPGARLLLVGPSSPRFDLEDPIRRAGLDDAVVREPYVEEARLWSLMAAADVHVSLRAPTMGETSGSAIRALSLGRPLVVSNLGWFAELPDDVALKVAVGEGEVQALAAALDGLASDPALRERMGAAARREAETRHDVDRVAERYVAVLEEAAGGAAVRERVARAVASAAADVGLGPDPVLRERLDEVGLNGGGPPVVAPAPRKAEILGVLPVSAWLALLVTASSVTQLLLGLRVRAPWIMVDELIYSDLARSFAETGHFLIRGAHGSYGIVYPALVSPAWLLASRPETAIALAKAIDAVVVSSAAIPAYLLARRVLRPPLPLLAALLAVALPSLVYAGVLMTENVFYPLFLWVALALVLMLERPTPVRQLVVLAACAVAFLTRAQAVALLPAVVTAPVLLAWIDPRERRSLRAYRPLAAVLAAGVLGAIAVELVRGRSPLDLLGAYSVTGHAHYHPLAILRWVVLHVAALDLYVGVLPFAALVVLVAVARHLERPVRVFAAASVALTVWLVLQVGAFASLSFVNRIEERNLFYLAPLFLTALLVWIDRGLPRPTRATAVAAGLAAALPGAIPFTRLVTIGSAADTLAYRPWWWIADSTDRIGILVVVACVALAGVFLLLPRRWAGAMPALVLLVFLFVWLGVEVSRYSFPAFARSSIRQAISKPDRDWIDRAAGRDAHVAVLWTGNGNALPFWENEIFNRSVRRVYDLDRPLPGGMPEVKVEVDRATGRIRGLDEKWVLTDPSIELVGTIAARDARRGVTLWHVPGGARTTTQITGLWANDVWSTRHVEYRHLACRGGSLSLTLRMDPSLLERQRVTVSTGPVIRLTKEHPQARLHIPLTARGGVCAVSFDVARTAVPEGRVPGSKDKRALGVRFENIRYRAP